MGGGGVEGEQQVGAARTRIAQRQPRRAIDSASGAVLRGVNAEEIKLPLGRADSGAFMNQVSQKNQRTFTMS